MIAITNGSIKCSCAFKDTNRILVQKLRNLFGGRREGHQKITLDYKRESGRSEEPRQVKAATNVNSIGQKHPKNTLGTPITYSRITLKYSQNNLEVPLKHP